MRILAVFLCLVVFTPIASQSQDIPELEISESELRVVVDDYFFYLLHKVEDTMDSINQSTKDIRVGQATMVFKTYCIAEAQRSVFVQNPLVGHFDMAALIFQMEKYYKGDNGDRLFGEYKGQVMAMITELKEVMILVTRTLNSNWDATDALESLDQYAEENPLLNDYFGRRSVRPFFERLRVEEKIKLKALAENMAASVDEMSQRMNYYVGMMPKQMRWQMELVAYNMLLDPTWKIDMDSIADSLAVDDWIDERMASVFEQVSRERELAMKDVDALKDDSFREMDIRIDSMKTWARTFSFEMTEEVAARMELAVNRMEDLASEQVSSALQQAESMANRILLRVFIGLAVLIVLYFVVRRLAMRST